MSFFRFGGSRIYYKILGKGEPILMIHGMLSSHKRMMPFAQDLSERGFSCLLIDLPLHGKSKGVFLSIEGLLVAVESLITSLEVEKYHCFGHSLGASVCSVLNRRDQRVKSLIAMSPVISDFRPMESVVGAIVSSIAHLKLKNSDLMMQIISRVMSPGASQDEVKKLAAPMLHTKKSSVLVDVLMEAQISCGMNMRYSRNPLLAVIGKYDPFSSPREIARYLPGFAKLLVLNKGHIDIQPSDFLKGKKHWVVDFLKSVS